MFLFYFLYQLQVLLDSCDLVSRSKLKLNSDGWTFEKQVKNGAQEDQRVRFQEAVEGAF